MKSLLKAFKPTTFGVLLILIVLSFQVLFCSSESISFSMVGEPDRQASAFGLGSPIRLLTVEGSTSYEIRWFIFACNLATTYVGAVLTAFVLVRITRLLRPALAFGLVAVLMVVVTFLFSIAASKDSWGYFFSRPALLSEVSEISHVHAVIPFYTKSDDSGKRTIVPDEDYSLSEHIAKARKDAYYCLDERILIELARRNLLPAAAANSLDGFPPLYPLIQSSGILAKSSEGYDSSAYLGGVAVNALDKSGGRLVFLGFTGGQLSNDHYPYYELVFRGRKDTAELFFANGQHFFYDAAGMEGFEWYVILLYLCVPGILIGFVIFTLGRIVWKRQASLP